MREKGILSSVSGRRCSPRRASVFGLFGMTVLTLAGCGQYSNSPGGPGGASPTTGSSEIAQSSVITVTSPEGVIAGRDDALNPLPAGAAPVLSAEAVRQRLMALSSDYAQFLGNPQHLTVKLGVYVVHPGPAPMSGMSSPMPSQPFIAYTYSGGQGPCSAAGHGPPVGHFVPGGTYVTPSPAPSPPPAVCGTIFVADASSGAMEFMSEWGLGSGGPVLNG